jgi:hypothetical protein
MPIWNFGNDPPELRVEPILFADIRGRCDHRMPPGARRQIVSDRNQDVEIQVGYRSIIILVRVGVDFEVTDENGVAHHFADRCLDLD